MKRYQEREQAFFFIFESLFGNKTLEEILESAKLAGTEKISDFAIKIFQGVSVNVEKIEETITKNLKNWKKERLPKTTLAILRLSVYEILFDEDIETGVSINEAVELAKKYSTPEDTSYVNGVLGSISKEISNKEKSIEE